MAQITINEISQNYTYNTGASSYATVALPITASWGPGYFDPKTYFGDTIGNEVDGIEHMLEHTSWNRFPATQAGLEAFIATYRGPATNYRLAKDFSYQNAITLLTSGYDVLVCRLCPGTHATGKLIQSKTDGGTGAEATISFRAKYPGTFGNNLQLTIKKLSYFDKSAGRDENFRRFYWNIITYIIDESGVKTSVENLSLVFNSANATDNILYYKDIESRFWEVTKVEGKVDETSKGKIPTAKDPAYTELQPYVRLGISEVNRGTDYNTTIEKTAIDLEAQAKGRFEWAADFSMSYEGQTSQYKYPEAIKTLTADKDDELLRIYNYKEWVLSSLVGTKESYNKGNGGVFDLLKDKLTYNPNRIISPGWDDQDYLFYEDDRSKVAPYIGPNTATTCELPISPLHLKIMDVAYHSRCATGYLDIPRVVDRKFVHIEDEHDITREGYIQKLARVTPKNNKLDVNSTLFHTHCALFAPWGQFTFVGTSKMNQASPSFIALMIQRSQILNQPIQYEWALPTNRKHHLRIGKLDYRVPKKLLDKWQKLDGASLNIITDLPDLGTNIWGNSTIFEVPPATYQALANLSTRFLVNAVKDVVYRVGLSITFQYNNNEALGKFHTGVTPILDTLKNVGAIEGYKIKMNDDVRGHDHVNANTIIGQILLQINGVINDINVDLICLPPGADLA